VHEIRRRRDDGSFETTELLYDANGQLAVVIPPAVDPDGGLGVVRSYVIRSKTPGEPP
jgi:hypothetical protein